MHEVTVSFGGAFLYVKFCLQKVAEHRDTCGVAEGPSSYGHTHPPTSDMVQWYINACHNLEIDCRQRKYNVQCIQFMICFRSEEELHNVKVTHKPPEGFVDKVSYLPNESARKWAGGLGYKSDMTCRSCVKNFGTQGTGFHEQQTFDTSWFIYTSNSTSLGYHIFKKK